LNVRKEPLGIIYGSGSDPISAIKSDIVSGRNDEEWNGSGINSSAAATNSSSYGLSYADGDNSTDVSNVSFTLASGTIVVAYSPLGDANMDGSLNYSDLAIMAADFGMGGADWPAGDFNYDGDVDLSDLVILVSEWGTGAPTPTEEATYGFGTTFNAEYALAYAEVHGDDMPAALSISVPEPTMLGVLVAGSGILLIRRRRRAAC
jgi:hypothetical protein